MRRVLEAGFGKESNPGEDAMSERRLQLLVVLGLIAYAAGLVTGWLVQ